MPRDPLDRLPVGIILADGWGGPVGRDDNDAGVYAPGPQPAIAWIYRLVVTSIAQGEPLPPHLAVILTRAAQQDRRIRQMIRRARIGQIETRRHRRTQRLTRYRAHPLAELRASA